MRVRWLIVSVVSLLVVVAAVSAGCGGGVTGVYTGSKGDTLELHSGGRMTWDAQFWGDEFHVGGTYRVDGDRLLLSSEGDLVPAPELRIEDGELLDPETGNRWIRK